MTRTTDSRPATAPGGIFIGRSRRARAPSAAEAAQLSLPSLVRTCKICGECKPLTRDHFYQRDNGGFEPRCIGCRRAARHARYRLQSGTRWRQTPTPAAADPAPSAPVASEIIVMTEITICCPTCAGSGRLTAKSIGARFRGLRGVQELATVAGQLGISSRRLSSIEGDLQPPTLAELKAAAKLWAISLDALTADA